MSWLLSVQWIVYMMPDCMFGEGAVARAGGRSLLRDQECWKAAFPSLGVECRSQVMKWKQGWGGTQRSSRSGTALSGGMFLFHMYHLLWLPCISPSELHTAACSFGAFHLRSSHKMQKYKLVMVYCICLWYDFCCLNRKLYSHPFSLST